MKRLCSLVLALALCLGLCVPAGAAEFSDVPAGHAFYGGILYCAENGIAGGYSDGTFGGEVTMNRGQAAVVIYRMTQAVPVEAPAPETPADPEPETPSTPTTPETPSTPAAGTLTNGKAITEANITEILNQLKSQYPNGTSFVNGYAGLNSGRGPYANCIDKTVKQYIDSDGKKCSTTFGCGGWAAFVADEIFGQTGVTWKKTTTSNLRPGDLMISIDNAGYLTHVSICVGPVDGYATNVRVYTTDASEGGQGYHLGWNRAVTSFSNGSLGCYTAYPN